MTEIQRKTLTHTHAHKEISKSLNHHFSLNGTKNQMNSGYVEMRNMKSETCNVCGRNVLGKAELCSFCRRPFERTRNKYPDVNYEELIILTKQFVLEQKARLKTKRDSNGKNM